MSERQSGTLMLERYQLTERLQVRDQTETWRARADDQDVVLKILSLADSPDWQAYTLFEREAEALRLLKHPRIPMLLDFVAEAHQIVMVQQAVAGQSLRTRMNSGWKVTEAQARALATDVLDTLQVLHSQSPPLIHRDIKPDNLLLDADDRVHLIDFGAVRQFAQNSYTVAGSFQYMAPEQLQGKALPCSDLYGLGMTLIELLSGSPLEELPREGLYLKFQDALFVSTAFKSWLERMVAPYPAQRFASAEDARAALQAAEALPELEQRGKLGPGHGKTALTPEIWLQEQPEHLELEFIGQKPDGAMLAYTFGLALSMVMVAGSPLTFVIVNDFYRFVHLPSGAESTFVLLVSLSLLSWLAVIKMMLRYLRRISKRHVLRLQNDQLLHDYTLKRGLRKPKPVSQAFAQASIQSLTLGRFQIAIRHRKKKRLKIHRFTLLVPFPRAAREAVAQKLKARGIPTDVR